MIYIMLLDVIEVALIILNLSKVHYIAFMVREIVLERRRGRERRKGSGRGGLKRKIVKLSDQYR